MPSATPPPRRVRDAARKPARTSGAAAAPGPARPSPAASPAPTGKAATQERILEAATTLFMQRGYEHTTVQEIADLAGVSRATVFWHFSEKAALFREAFSRLLRPFRESLERDLAGLDAAQRLSEHLAASQRFAREHREEVGALVRWALTTPPFGEMVLTTLLDLNQRFAGTITQAVTELAPAGQDPQLLATGLMLAFDAGLILDAFDPSERRAAERSAAVEALARLVTQQARGAARPAVPREG